MLIKRLTIQLCFIMLALSLAACRPAQEATNYTITAGELNDGDLIKGDDDDDDDNPKYYGDEIFEQNAATSISAVDIVWVIDNSGSMSEEQQNLQNNFDSFIDKFLVDGKAQYPFKMGVVTSEAYRAHENKNYFQGPNCSSSNPQCSQYELTSAAAENDFTKFKNDFKAAVGVGTKGHGNEKSLYSAHIIEEQNKNWFGGNDTLSVYIFVSDEQEQSHLAFDNDSQPLDSSPLYDENGNQYTIEKWVNVFKAKKADGNLTRFFPIVRLKPVPGDYGDGDVGDKYKKAAELTGGVRSDIDKPFDGVLNGISQTIINLIDSFLLKDQRKIIESSIVVTVDGQISTDWTYQSNSIKFNNPPADGAEIRVRYEYNQ